MKRILFGASGKSLELPSPDIDIIVDDNWFAYSLARKIKLELHWRIVKRNIFHRMCFPSEYLRKIKNHDILIFIGDIFRREDIINLLQSYGFEYELNVFDAFCLSPKYCELEHNKITDEDRIKKDIENDWLKIKKMADLIPKSISSVSDMGCGNQVLKEYISDNILYQGYDYRDCGQEFVVDLNSGDIMGTKTEVIFCCGILEFITDWKRFLTIIANRGAKYIILSYSPREFSNISTYRSKVYHNCIYSAEIVSEICSNGYVLDVFERFESRQAVYRFIKK